MGKLTKKQISARLKISPRRFLSINSYLQRWQKNAWSSFSWVPDQKVIDFLVTLRVHSEEELGRCWTRSSQCSPFTAPWKRIPVLLDPHSIPVLHKEEHDGWYHWPSTIEDLLTSVHVMKNIKSSHIAPQPSRNSSVRVHRSARSANWAIRHRRWTCVSSWTFVDGAIAKTALGRVLCLWPLRLSLLQVNWSKKINYPLGNTDDWWCQKQVNDDRW